MLLGRGLGVEIGLFHAEAAASWAESDMAQHCMRVMIELRPDADVAIADDLLDQVRAGGSPAPVLLHGLDESCWPLLEHAGGRGVQTRIGMEDTLRAARRVDGARQRRAGGCGGAAAQSVGRGQGEVGEVEARHHHAAHQARLVVPRPGALPVPRGHQQLRLLAGADVAAE